MLLEPDLPLGIAAEEKYVDHIFRVERGDKLTLLSDGVVEARDARGALFGFDRTRAISAQSASAIAAAALAFGQEDDITVLTLTRAPREGDTVVALETAVVPIGVGLG
jgi:serine phosphatase RsbU (regulator of sigma subunit)